MLKALTALASDPNNVVWIISGRDQKVLEEWLGEVENLGFSAEHGSFMRQPGSKKWINLTESLDMSWKNDVIEIFTYYSERTQGKPTPSSQALENDDVAGNAEVLIVFNLSISFLQDPSLNTNVLPSLGTIVWRIPSLVHSSPVSVRTILKTLSSPSCPSRSW